MIDDGGLEQNGARPRARLGQSVRKWLHVPLPVISGHLELAPSQHGNAHHEAIRARADPYRDGFDLRADRQAGLQRQVGDHVDRFQISPVVGVVISDRTIPVENGVPVPVHQPIFGFGAAANGSNRLVDKPGLGAAPAGGEVVARPAPEEKEAGIAIRIARSEPAVVHQDLHGAQLLPAFPHDLTVDQDVAADDLHRLARQPHHALDVGLRRLAGKVEDRDLPAPGGRKS